MAGFPIAGNTGYGMLNPGTTTLPPGTTPFHETPQRPNNPTAPPKLPGQIIPDAGVYGQDVNAANEAYQNALTNALASRNSLYNQYGLLNNGQVDPNNPYGQYEQMLNSQASQLTADEQNAIGRGLGTGGLARQQVSADRAAQAAQNFAFQQQVGANETNYQQALANALGTRDSSIASAYQDALNTALQNMIANMQTGTYTHTSDDSNNDNNDNNDNTKPPVTTTTKKKAPTDVVARYLANRAA